MKAKDIKGLPYVKDDEVVFAVDTSGDVDQELVEEFVNHSLPRLMPDLNSVIFEEEYSLWLNSHTKCYVDLSGSRRLGKVKKINAYTCWVKIMIGAKTSIIIKRHIEKHHVRWV